MKLYLCFLRALIEKHILRKNTGLVVKKFCESMGVVYIKLAQILATQNFGEFFTEEDRRILSSICDNCRPIDFAEIKEAIEMEYDHNIDDMFLRIDEKPLGSASISQVHKAVLKNGTEVAVKVKRRDIAVDIEKNVARIRRLMRRFGKLFGLKNLIGGDKALELYLTWIKEEVDFAQERKNIGRYRNFANSVNGKVEGTKNIVVPNVYEDLCTENIIVMDFVASKTINQMRLNTANKARICEALNSYVQLSFYALFHDGKIIFHGDPHGANVFVDENGDIGFLDMGLLFELTDEDARMTREFFLSAYAGNYEKLCELLMPFGDFDVKSRMKFEGEMAGYCQEIKTLPITAYFMRMFGVCLKHDIAPPNFLFCMSKTFICLDGISGFSGNATSAVRLLKEQIAEFYIRRSLRDGKNLVTEGILMAPNLLNNALRYGLTKGLAKEVSTLENIHAGMEQALANYKEALAMLRREA